MSGSFYISVMGCPKNEVDAEVLAASLAKKGMKITPEPHNADILIVMSCGFTDDARIESTAEILRLSTIKASGDSKRLVVAGCFSQLYPKEMLEEIPEIDSLYGVDEMELMGEELPNETHQNEVELHCRKRVRLTSAPYAYLKISDGCDRSCAFCSIPSIKGKLRSTNFSWLIAEAEELVEEGVREVVLVAQDVTSYGRETGQPDALAALVQKLCAVDGLERVRLMYLYPDEVDQRFIESVFSHEKVCKYFDLPLQHCSEEVISAMNRKGSAGDHLRKIEMIRSVYPDAALRSSFIIGHPGERAVDFEELLDFIEESGIDWIAAFPYSLEQGTPSAALCGKVPEEEIIDRLNEFNAVGNELMIARRALRVGGLLNCLVDRFRDGVFECRSELEAPEIDGTILLPDDIIYDDDKISAGEMIKCRITGSSHLDLLGEPVC